MRGIYKLVKYIFTTFCKIFTRIKISGAYITCSQLCVIFSFWNTVMHLGYLKFQEKRLHGGVALIIKIYN